jgi:hypothetical protein
MHLTDFTGTRLRVPGGARAAENQKINICRTCTAWRSSSSPFSPTWPKLIRRQIHGKRTVHYYRPIEGASGTVNSSTQRQLTKAVTDRQASAGDVELIEFIGFRRRTRPHHRRRSINDAARPTRFSESAASCVLPVRGPIVCEQVAIVGVPAVGTEHCAATILVHLVSSNPLISWFAGSTHSGSTPSSSPGLAIHRPPLAERLGPQEAAIGPQSIFQARRRAIRGGAAARIDV